VTRDGEFNIFGTTLQGNIWHKSSPSLGLPWDPKDRFPIIPAEAKDCPSILDRDRVLWVSSVSRHVFLVDSSGSNASSHSSINYLGGYVLDIASVRLDDRIDCVVGRMTNGSYTNTGCLDYLELGSWGVLGGNFFSKPALALWGTARVDLIGIDADTGSLHHKFLFNNGWTEWEDLGGGPFIGNPIATSWGEGRMDFWAISSEGELNHLFWDGFTWKGWENLGGRFTNTPTVVHYDRDRIDIVGKNIDNEKFNLKSWDGTRWNPDPLGWYTLAGPYASEPGLMATANKSERTSFIFYIWLTLGTDYLSVLGIDDDEVLKEQRWDGTNWLPSAENGDTIGKIPSVPDERAKTGHEKSTMDSFEL
jgi:hypothetical protein